MRYLIFGGRTFGARPAHPVSGKLGDQPYSDEEMRIFEALCVERRNERDFALAFLDTLLDTALEPTLIIHGGAKGADSIGGEWAIGAGIRAKVFLPDWSIGKSAGIIRNQQMLELGKPDRAIGFPGGRGTADMAARLKKANTPLVEVQYP